MNILYSIMFSVIFFLLAGVVSLLLCFVPVIGSLWFYFETYFFMGLQRLISGNIIVTTVVLILFYQLAGLTTGVLYYLSGNDLTKKGLLRFNIICFIFVLVLKTSIGLLLLQNWGPAGG